MKKNSTKNKLPKYEYGTYVDDVSTDLYNNQMMLIHAADKAKNNPWAKGLNVFGNLAMQVGTSMMNSGMSKGEGADGKGAAGFLNKNNGAMNSLLGSVQTMGNQGFAFGGAVPVEVEGKEVAETPQGNLLDFTGASHENGGIPVSLPEGTEIYSKRIKVDGVSMADRKKKRERKSISLESLLEKNASDVLIKNAASRTKFTNEVEENADNKIQQVIKQLMTTNDKGELVQHAWGTGVDGPDDQMPTLNIKDLFKMFSGLQGTNENIDYGKVDSYFTDKGISDNASLEGQGVTDENKSWDTFATSMNREYTPSAVPDAASSAKEGDESGAGGMFGSGMTLGDAVGMAGTLYSTFAPMKNTKDNRAGDTPNINAFKDFGKDGLATLDKTKQYVNQVRDSKLKDLELNRTGSIKRNNNSARSVGTLRALNLATDAAVNNTEEQTYNSFAEQMMNILSQQAGMENQQDYVVMSGEQAKDLADRQDRDNYYSQLAQDISTKGTGLQETGKDMNKIKERGVMENLLNQLSAYGITVDANGNLSNPNKKKK